jgi:uncharacterized membrane protein YdfJ with MMPL/SSD domain
MTYTPDHDHQVEPDPELARLLQEWTAPALPDSLDDRVSALWRRRAARRPLWRRLFATSIRVPLPVALALLAVLLLNVFWHPRERRPELDSAESAAPPRAARHETRPGLAGGLAGFEPVREMKVKVLPESSAR